MNGSMQQLPHHTSAQCCKRVQSSLQQQHLNAEPCRHHQSYVRRLKEALRKAPELLEKDLNQLMQAVGTVSIWHPEADRDIRNQGGGDGHWHATAPFRHGLLIIH